MLTSSSFSHSPVGVSQLNTEEDLPNTLRNKLSQYDDEERAAYDNAFQDVIDSAKRLGITLPGSNGDENEEDEVDKGEDHANEGEAAESKDEEEEGWRGTALGGKWSSWTEDSCRAGVVQFPL